MSVSEPPMLQKIATRSGLVFDAWVAGPAEGDLVVLLHGYPQSRHAWRDQIPALGWAGMVLIVVSNIFGSVLQEKGKSANVASRL